MANVLTLSVAGGRKTQGIVDHCAVLPAERRALIVTFTKSNQSELVERIERQVADNVEVSVWGWYTFLLRDFARPFFPFMFAGRKIEGFNFEGRPYRKASGIRRFLDANNNVYACELGRLANELVDKSNGALIHRLECIYDEILIDEIQDLSAHDWHILEALLSTSIDIKMVGDIRQSVLSTNPRSSMNKRYKYSDSIHWFRNQEKRGNLKIVEISNTWRCHQDIADFSDSIFPADRDFSKTRSLNTLETGHDGIFLVRERDAQEYLCRYVETQCLRHSASSGKKYDFDFMNFKVAKGRTFERVMIVPTKPISNFIRDNVHLESTPACAFYVAVTRAKQSVAILIPNTGKFPLPIWEP